MNTENHYQETDLGNISLNPRGEYNPEESYEYLDLVVLEGGSYVCLAENGATITGISPESGKTTQYWQVITIPGSLTPEYIAMHDRVVNLSEQVGADAEEVRTAEQNVSGMELNVTQMQEQTRQSAEAAEQSKDSSAGYAASADASRQAAEESKQNIDAQVTGFDSHVAEKTEEAENDIEAARIAANKAIIAQQEQSVNEVARAGIEAISTAQSAAQTATEKAQAADTSEKNAAASETAAKLSETNATKMAGQVAADKEQVANDRTAVENAKQEMTGSVAQIEQNTQGISELKGDLSQFTNPIGTNFNVNNFTIGGKSSYGSAPTSSKTRVTNKIAGMSFLYNTTITPKDNSVKHYIYRQNNPSINWNSAPYTMESGQKYDYVCAYADDRVITDIEDLLSHFTLIGELTEKVLEINETIEKVKTIPSETGEYLQKTISILGDSISTFAGYSYDGNRTRYPQSNLLTDVNDTYWMRIINALGLRLGICEAWAGSMVSNTQSEDSGDKGPNRHMASQTRINHLGENGNPDIILVNGGTNDIYATSDVGTFNTENPRDYTDEQIANLPVATFADAYRTMLIRLQKTYPNSKIICLLPNYTTSYYTPTKADQYCEVIKEACDFFGVKWKDMRTIGITMFNRDAYLPDGIHPNAIGMEMMAKNILKDLRYDFTI